MTQPSKPRRIHPAWYAFGVTFLTLAASAGYRSAPSVLIIPLQDAFGWSRSTIAAAISINTLLFGLTAPFAAALMERFTVRKVVMSALTTVGIGSISTIFITRPWHLMLLWGVVVGIGTGSMALVFAANIANRWFIGPGYRDPPRSICNRPTHLLAISFNPRNPSRMEERRSYRRPCITLTCSADLSLLEGEPTIHWRRSIWCTC